MTHRPLRLIRNHPYLFVSIAVSCVAFAVESAVAPHAMISTRLLIAWDAGVLLYLALACSLLARFDIALVRERAAIHDEGGVTILMLTVAAAIASLGAVVAELGAVTASASRGRYFALAAATILLSWMFIHVIFALHYAHEYYGEGEKGGGLAFPQDDCPDYWDFVYFAFVIGMTFQVSDVQVTSKVLRRAVVAHGAIAFVFSVAILALFVNLGAALFEAPGPG
jgi:uncharacterized membrane protein